jgi:hypothetical protein
MIFDHEDSWYPEKIKEKIEKWTKAKTAYDYYDIFYAVLDNKDNIPIKVLFNRNYDVLLGTKEEPMMRIHPDEGEIVFDSSIEDSVIEQWKKILYQKFPFLNFAKEGVKGESEKK